MNVWLGKEHGEFSAKWVIERLRAFSSIEPPDALKDRLLAGIPASAEARPVPRQIRPWSRGLQWATATAAAVVLMSAVAWLGSPWGRHAESAFDANTGLGPAYAADHNSLRPSDSNAYDTNGLP